MSGGGCSGLLLHPSVTCFQWLVVRYLCTLHLYFHCSTGANIPLEHIYGGITDCI